MLPGTGYFRCYPYCYFSISTFFPCRALPCPFFQMGFCERPYCHFKHVPRGAKSIEYSYPHFNLIHVSFKTGAPEPTTAPSSESTLHEATAPPSATIHPEKKPPSEIPVKQEFGEKLAGKSEIQTAEPSSSSLEAMVQAAVRKVLLEGGTNAAALLGGVNTGALLAKVKQEQQEDEDSDCVIEDEIPAPSTAPAADAAVKSEEVTKPKLYLPPQDTPTYNPTPIEKLQGSSVLPGSVLQASSLQSGTSKPQPLVRSGKARSTYKKPTAQAVLGDLGDLSDSDNEQTPDVLGGILKEGNKSGVLVGGVVSEFEEQVIKERLKQERKKENKIVEELKKMRAECEKKEQKDEEQCAQVTTTSSNLNQKDKAEEKEPKEETEAERVEKKLRKEEEEVRKLEEKRKMLENFYNARLKEKQGEGDANKSKESKDVKQTESKKKKKRSRSRSRHREKTKKSKRRHRTPESQTDENESSSQSESESSKRKESHKSKHSSGHHKHKSREREKEDSERKRSHSSKKRKRHKSSTEDPSRSPSKEKKGPNTPRSSMVGSSEQAVIVVKVEKDVSSPKVDRTIVDSDEVEEEKPTPPIIKIKSLDSLLEKSSEVVQEDKTKGEEEKKGDESEDGSDLEFVAETGRSFMSAMSECESKPKKEQKSSKSESHSRKSDHKSSRSDHKSSRSENKSSKSEHKSSKSEHKSSKSEHKSSRSEHKSSRSENKSSKSDHKSSKSEHKSSKSEHKSSKSDHKSSKSSSQHHKSSSHSKSSSRDHKSSRDKERSKTDAVIDEQESAGEFDIPDLSQELALLPEDIGYESPEPDDDIERVAGDLEDIFAGVEDDDELQKIFDSYKEEEATAPIVDPSQRKRKAADEVGSSLTGTIVGKKRVALGGASEAEKRPLHMKKPSKMTPAQAMHDRYKKIQALKQQQLLEKRLTELTEDTASTSTSGGSTSTSLGESSSTAGKKRVAHTSTSTPVEKNKAKQQVSYRVFFFNWPPLNMLSVGR